MQLVEHLSGVAPGGKPKPIRGLSHLNSAVSSMLRSSLLTEAQIYMEKAVQLARFSTKNPSLASNPDYLTTKFPGVDRAEIEGMVAWGKKQPADKPMSAVRESWPKSLDGLDACFKTRILEAAKSKLPSVSLTHHNRLMTFCHPYHPIHRQPSEFFI